MSGCQLAPEVSSRITIWPAEKIDPLATVTEEAPWVAFVDSSCM